MSLAQELVDQEFETQLIARGYTNEEARQIARGEWSSRRRELSLFVATNKYLNGVLSLPSLTAKTYRLVTLQFCDWLSTQWQEIPEEDWTLDRIRPSDVERFTKRPKINGSSRGPSTISKETAVISSMFRWLKDRGLTDLNPAETASRPNKPLPLPVALSDDQQQHLLDLSRRTTCGLRNHTIITLTLNTGLRASEVCRLTKADIDLDGKTIKAIRSKRQGNPVQILPLLPAVEDALRYYLQVTRNRVAAPGCDNHLFVNEKGKNWGHPMTVDGLETMMKPLLVKLGKGPGCNFHVLRHSFAVNLLRRGLSLMIIQALLGHASLETTRTYLRLHNAEVIKALSDAFPDGVLVPGTARNMINADLTARMTELFCEED